MTTAEAYERLEKIREVAARYEDEVAHIEEDNLHADVLRAIRDGGIETIAEARTLAGIALRTDDLDFSRWHA